MRGIYCGLISPGGPTSSSEEDRTRLLLDWIKINSISSADFTLLRTVMQSFQPTDWKRFIVLSATHTTTTLICSSIYTHSFMWRLSNHIEGDANQPFLISLSSRVQTSFPPMCASYYFILLTTFKCNIKHGSSSHYPFFSIRIFWPDGCLLDGESSQREMLLNVKEKVQN